MSSKLSRLYWYEITQCSSTETTLLRLSLFLSAPNNGNFPSCHSTIQYLKGTELLCFLYFQFSCKSMGLDRKFKAV